MKSVVLSNFDQEVLQSSIPVIVDFWASWCGPCRSIKPILETLGSESNGKFKVVGVDIDESPELASKYGVSAIPTILVFKDGEISENFVGVRTKQELLKAVE